MPELNQATDSDLAHSYDELLQDALHVVRIHLDLEVSFISEFEGGRRIFRYVDAEARFCPVTVGNSDPVEESFCQRVVDGRLPELMTDARENPEALTLKVTTEMPIGAHISVPIRVGDEIFGTFCLFSREPKSALDHRDLEVVRLYADFVGRLLSRTVQAQRLALPHHKQIRRVLDEQLYYMVYQPIFHVGMRKLVGREVLTRFTAEPIQSPDRWFIAASGVGLQAELELAVIRRALADFQHFPEETYLSFNVSPQSILHDKVLNVFAGYPLERIVLEVTEHDSIDDYAIIARKLESLRKRGLRLAVDDAGAGYASFRHILKLKPDIIKLDRTLVAAIDTDDGIRALAAALIRFAEETGSKIVAEGVETEQELEVLRQLNVNKVQGYLLGRPSPLEASRSSFPL